jgi:hypothetical protein
VAILHCDQNPAGIGAIVRTRGMNDLLRHRSIIRARKKLRGNRKSAALGQWLKIRGDVETRPRELPSLWPCSSLPSS